MAQRNAPPLSWRTVFANAYIVGVFLVWTLLMFVLFPPYVLGRMLAGNTPGKAARCGIWRYARTLVQLLAPVVPVRVEQRDMVRRHAPCVLIANHLSFLDLYLFAMQDEPDLCMVTKSWPFRLLFFFAPGMHAAGYLDVESLGPAVCEDRAVERLRAGATVIIFPEGRRSRTGERGRFHSGAFRLAVRAGVPVVPLVISGSDTVFAVGSRWFAPGPITLRFLQPLHPEEVNGEPLPHRALLRRASALYEREPCTSSKE